MKPNRKLFKLVCDHILKKPRTFTMAAWVRDTPDCGTTACIAGWATLLGDTTDPRLLDSGGIFDRAKRLLNLDLDSAVSVFYDISWPVEFREAFARSRSSKQNAKVAVARIKYFLRTGK